MNTYLVTFKEYDYDQYDAFVVVAEDQGQVISILKAKYPEDKSYSQIEWRSKYTIEPVDTTTAGIVLGSFHAG